jgi:hypothetical protein
MERKPALFQRFGEFSVPVADRRITVALQNNDLAVPFSDDGAGAITPSRSVRYER